jgi:hypothetical protein
MPERIDDQLLDEFIRTFYGYGNSQGRFWLVGMEEGGGDSVEAIQKRLNYWAGDGQRDITDLPATAAAMGGAPWFGERAKLQRTWGMLIRAMLAVDGESPSTEQVKGFQQKSLGRSGGDNCLVELLPLPSPSIRHWIYGECSEIEFLKTRQEYQTTCIPWRIAHLKKVIAERAPPIVIFYGFAYLPHWLEIAGVEFSLQSDAHFGRNKESVFVVTKHPAAKGVTKEYFHRVGRSIREMLKTR